VDMSTGSTTFSPLASQGSAGPAPPNGNSASNSCQGNCGTKAETCWCDDNCAKYGDCCTDHKTFCAIKEVTKNTVTNQGTCAGNCGLKTKAGCWCDSLCTKNKDCCDDYVGQCSASMVGDSGVNMNMGIPAAPVAPIMPAPIAPVAPVAPIAPVAPVAPVGPVVSGHQLTEAEIKFCLAQYQAMGMSPTQMLSEINNCKAQFITPAAPQPIAPVAPQPIAPVAPQPIVPAAKSQEEMMAMISLKQLPQADTFAVMDAFIKSPKSGSEILAYASSLPPLNMMSAADYKAVMINFMGN
jgi:hypothetical protein